MQEFLRQIEEIVEMPPGSATPADCFRDYENWDSLASLVLLNHLQEEHGVVMSGQELLLADTVAQLWDLVQSRR